jgi:asparagine synthase (glutamine-hydrolysing)
MCGITGIACLGGPLKLDRPIIEAMCASIRHRGPDDEGIFMDHRVALGVRRLAVIDVEGGRQPVISKDGSVVLTLNGEIYNFRELRQELLQQGYTFKTHSDTEVVLVAYLAYGSEFVHHLDGMFAIAVYDQNRNYVLLARDPLGIKPLFYTLSGGNLIWGSEIKAILASGLVDRKLNLEAVAEFMQWEYVPTPGTLFDSIYKLEAGSLIQVSLDQPTFYVKPAVYWQLPMVSEPISAYDIDELVLEQLEKSTKAQMVSDVPLGTFLSGGVDSSMVASFMGRATAFSIGFDDASYDELPYARAVAGHLGMNLHAEIVKPDVAGLFEQLMYHLDDPIADFSIFPTFLLSKLAREHVTVALSGDGGDELFGGYDTYRAQGFANQLGPLARVLSSKPARSALSQIRPSSKKKGFVNKLVRFCEGLSQQQALGHARWRAFISPDLATELYSSERMKQHAEEAGRHVVALYCACDNFDQINRALYVDTRSYLMDNCLVKTDRMSMANSLEVRVPLLSKNVVELAFKLSAHQKIRRGETKILLKRLAARRVPKQCVYRAKEGFSIPIKNWLSDQFRPMLEEATTKASLDDIGLFNATKVAELKSQHLAGRANHSHILWSLIVLHNWKRQWLKT